MKWEAGRQGTGYRKLEIFRGKRWDLHLIDYPPGVGIPWHADELPWPYRHLRVNLVLRRGGSHLDVKEGAIARLGDRIVAFWSDRDHRVSPNRLRRLVLSLGVAV